MARSSSRPISGTSPRSATAIRALRLSEERLSLALESGSDGLWDWDIVAGRRWRSARWSEMLGYDAADFANDHEAVWEKLIHPEDQRASRRRHAAAPRWSNRRSTNRSIGCAARMEAGPGSWRAAEWWPATSTANRCAWSAPTSTARRGVEAEQKIEYLACYDALTGVANRSLFNARLAAMVEEAGADGSRVKLILIDLDRFKELNDTEGHVAGDQMLRTVANRLRQFIGKEGIVGRLGGDEFAIALPNARLGGNLPDRIMTALRTPALVGDTSQACKASLGVAIFPDDAGNDDELLKAADIALYAAKDAGRGTYQRFNRELRLPIERRHLAVERARSALARDAIEPFYQPKVDLRTGYVVGFEALLRWRTEGGQISGPADLMEAFEDGEIALELGARMQDRIIADMADWRDQSGRFRPHRH